MQQVEHTGVAGEIELRTAVCNHCGSEAAGHAEARANKRAMVAFRKRVDGLMTGEEIRRFRKNHGLTQDEAAQLFGGGKVAFSRYENDDIAQSEAMDSLIRLCDGQPANILSLARRKELHLSDKVRVRIREIWLDVLARELAPRIRKTLDAQLHNQGDGQPGRAEPRKHPSVVELQKWRREAA